MNKPFTSLILIVAGLLVIVMGTRREDSVAGISESVGTTVANAWDGKARQPKHVWYYATGGVLIVAGIASALRRKAP
ncbi:MAG: hypothetical protein RLZZ129_1561 [Verrucomicrobiota bacterium]|jgi:hypothetical protein|nr:DUF3185 family protein [Opitutaceae bacterium]HRJ48315.1 DUF3185 family protein [Opitutaceae bacterium]